MKKLFLIFICLLSFCISAYAGTKPIPTTMSKQYKIEMEQIIDKRYPEIIKDIDNLQLEAKTLRDKIIQNGFNFEDYANLTLLSESCIPSADLYLYTELMKVTQEKYLGMEYQPIETDDTYPLYEYLYTYIKNNKVNEDKLFKIFDYENKKIKVVEKYIKQVEALRK